MTSISTLGFSAVYSLCVSLDGLLGAFFPVLVIPVHEPDVVLSEDTRRPAESGKCHGAASEQHGFHESTPIQAIR